MKPTYEFELVPMGPFDLLHQNQYFNGWPTLKADPTTIVMAFPVEGWEETAAVTLSQRDDGSLAGAVYGAKHHCEKARDQALAAMSLDVDGRGWPEVARRDSFVGELQKKYRFMRPTMFHSPYEATAAFQIGHRIQIKQTRAIRTRLSEEFGDAVEVGDETVHGFPSPAKLLTIQAYKGINSTKITRLHATAQSALDGVLDRNHLRSLNEGDALAELEKLPGIGRFFSQGILQRGAGVADGITHDDMTDHALKSAYGNGAELTGEQIEAIIGNWSPYRMWVLVLMHVWLRESGNLPPRTFSAK